jgi:D-alanyl-D-alanine carboxypeptidase
MSPLRRAVPLAAAVGLVLSATPSSPPVVAQSGENVRYAAIVVDAASGEVLFARHADARRYPASLTKVMTLYMAFEALAEGRVQLTDEITVSPRAASQPPSKLGLAAGQTITVDNAMRSLAVRSANDMAVALAEHLGGSEARFSAQMTLKAQQLGMTQSRFVNPHGLPDARQLTTARDLAILTRAVMRDYPQYYHYFGQHHWVYNGREYANTNGLLHSGAGYDGIKTGYTNASGYNLAASAVRDGRRVNTIVLGGRSTASRNAHVAELMNTAFEFEALREGDQPVQLAQVFFEQRGFGVGGDVQLGDGPVAYASLDRAPAEAPVAAGSDSDTVGTALVALAAGPAAETSGLSLTDRLNGGRAAATPAPTPAPARGAAPTPARAEPAGRWAVQVGAFRDRDVAQGWLTEVNRRFRSQFRGTEQTVQTAGEWYRSRFVGLTEQAAREACEALSARRVTCAVIRPD